MSHEPPVPAANQSPYPIEEPPQQHVDLPPVADASDGEAESLRQKTQDLVEKVGDLGAENRAAVGIGAAVVIGALATVTAILFTRRRPRKPVAQRRRASAKPRTRKAPTRKAA